MTTLNYTSHALATGARVTDVPRSGQTVSGYGSRIPTPYLLTYDGREYRVYALSYGNAASLYIRVRGELTHLDTDTEHRLGEVRDGMPWRNVVHMTGHPRTGTACLILDDDAVTTGNPDDVTCSACAAVVRDGEPS